MVSARLVDCPDSPEVQQSKPIPKMMFATGEEPVGVRVLTNQSSGAIKRILNKLRTLLLAKSWRLRRHLYFWLFCLLSSVEAAENEEKARSVVPFCWSAG